MPCHGPHCSGGGGRPLMPAPAPQTTGEERWGQSVTLRVQDVPDRTERFLNVISDRPIRLPPDVFHPPRLS